MTITLNFLVLSTSELESKGVSLERVVEYAALPPEVERHCEADDALPSSWPAGGRLEFQDVTLRYRPSLPPALHRFSCSVAAGGLLPLARSSQSCCSASTPAMKARLLFCFWSFFRL